MTSAYGRIGSMFLSRTLRERRPVWVSMFCAEFAVVALTGLVAVFSPRFAPAVSVIVLVGEILVLARLSRYVDDGAIFVYLSGVLGLLAVSMWPIVSLVLTDVPAGSPLMFACAEALHAPTKSVEILALPPGVYCTGYGSGGAQLASPKSQVLAAWAVLAVAVVTWVVSRIALAAIKPSTRLVFEGAPST